MPLSDAPGSRRAMPVQNCGTVVGRCRPAGQIQAGDQLSLARAAGQADARIVDLDPRIGIIQQIGHLRPHASR